MGPRRGAAFSLLLLLAFGACAKAPPSSEQRSPSGRVYRVVGTGTLPVGGGASGLGIEYVPESLEADRLAQDAEELMTLLSSRAEKAGLSTLVVTAYLPSRLPRFLRRRTASTTVFARDEDRVWRVRSPQPAPDAASRAADLRAIDEAYGRIERAVSARDAADLEALQAPGFWHRLADGGIRPRAEENAALESSLASVAELSARMTVSTVTVSGAQAVVVASMTSTGALKGSKRRFRSTTVSRDTWVRTPQGWRLSLSADLDDRFEPDARR